MTTNALWVVLIIIALILIIVGFAWGGYASSRAERANTQRLAETGSATQGESHTARSDEQPSASPKPRILWRDDIEAPPDDSWSRVESRRPSITLGDLTDIPGEAITESPVTSEPRKCPLCKHFVELDENARYHRVCDTYYHVACWTELQNNYGGQCLICRNPLS